MPRATYYDTLKQLNRETIVDQNERYIISAFRDSRGIYGQER